MPGAPGELYTAGAGLLESAGNQASSVANDREKSKEASMRAGESAGSNLSAERQTASTQQAQMALEKLKATDKMQGKIMTITPQIALGLAKNTGDKEWMQAIGQDMRSDVLLGMYTHGLSLAQARKSPKVTQVYDANGKIRHAVVYTDEEGNIQQHVLDEGFTPEKLHPTKPGNSAEDKKTKEFMLAHEKQAALFNDAKKSSRLKDSDPEQWNREHEEYVKDQDRYDQLKTSLGKGGGAAPGAGGDGSAAPDNSPFDADAFIQSALGDGGSRGGL